MKALLVSTLMLCVGILNTACSTMTLDSMYGPNRNITFNRCFVPSCERHVNDRFAAQGNSGMDDVIKRKWPHINSVTSNTQVENHYDGTSTVDVSP